MSTVQEQRKVVEQLRVECNMQRVPMSQSIKDLIAFTESNKGQDYLIIGVDKKINPFVEKSSCTVL